MRKIIGMIGLAGLILITAVYAADWSNPNPRSGGDSAGQLLLKHELNMTDLYDTATGKLNLLKESFAGAVAPTSPEAGQPWYDTTNDLFQIYDTTWGAGGFYSSATSSLYNLTSNGTATIPNLKSSNVSITGGSIVGITDLAIADGGTGASTKTTAFDALAPNTTKGDLIVHNGTNNIRLPLGSNGQVLYVDTSTASGFTYTSVSALPAGNADTVDGFHASQTPIANQIPVLNASSNLNLTTAASNLYMSNNTAISMKDSGGVLRRIIHTGINDVRYLGDIDQAQTGFIYLQGTTANALHFVTQSGADSVIWHQGNDGSGSGLDADTVDGFHASQTPGSNQIPALSSTGLLKLPGLSIDGNQINEWATNGVAGISINYTGYNEGLTQYRNFSVYDGKTNAILTAVGSSGKVGIGTTNPNSILHVIDNAQNGFKLERTSATARKWVQLILSDGTWDLYDETAAADRVTVNTSGAMNVVAGPLSVAGNTVWHAGNDGPHMRALRASTSQSITSGAAAKVQLNSETFDTNNAFDSATNYRFQPAVAGYYQMNGGVYVTATTALTYIKCSFYKNGGGYVGGFAAPYSGTDGQAQVSDIIYLNGSSDYVELWVYAVGTGTLNVFASSETFMSAGKLK